MDPFVFLTDADFSPNHRSFVDVGGLFPNGDYTIFVGRDHAFGIVGHPWERSLRRQPPATNCR